MKNRVWLVTGVLTAVLTACNDGGKTETAGGNGTSDHQSVATHEGTADVETYAKLLSSNSRASEVTTKTATGDNAANELRKILAGAPCAKDLPVLKPGETMTDAHKELADSCFQQNRDKIKAFIAKIVEPVRAKCDVDPQAEQVVLKSLPPPPPPNADGSLPPPPELSLEQQKDLDQLRSAKEAALHSSACKNAMDSALEAEAAGT